MSVELDPGYSAAQHGLLLKLVAVLTAATVVEVRAYRSRVFEQTVEVVFAHDWENCIFITKGGPSKLDVVALSSRCRKVMSWWRCRQFLQISGAIVLRLQPATKPNLC